MSEQEKMTGGMGPSGPSVVMVESGARHKQPYRPTELQDEAVPDLHHKRTRAPAVPSVAEELKTATETSGAKERKESERAISSEKHKSNAAKKLSSHAKRRGSSPEAITLAPLEVETKRTAITSPPQPIPAQVGSMGSLASDATDKFGEDKKDDDDSIKEDIADLRTSVVAKPSSEWLDRDANVGDKTVKNVTTKSILLEDVNTLENVDISQEEANKYTSQDENNTLQEVIEDFRKENTPLKEAREDTLENIHSPQETDVTNANNATDNIHAKKKEISWNDNDYLQTGMDVRSYAWNVERKAPIGPYFQSTPTFGGPSGITICIPKKSRKGINEELNTMPSVINITVSKKSIVNRTISQSNNEHRRDKLNLKIGDAPNVTFLGALRGRVNEIRDKIRNTLNI